MNKITTNNTRLIGVITAAAILAAAFVGMQAAQAAVVTTMGPGDSGTGVTDLQVFLAGDTSIYPEQLVTGFYGPLTTAAVQRFQCKQGIVCDGDVSTTGYGRVGPLTLARIQSIEGVAFIIPNIPNTGADVSAPILGTATVTAHPTSATISWSTNEPALHAVMYGLSYPFFYGSAPAMWSSTGLSSNASVTLTGLIPGHVYYFVRQSVDMSGNVQYDVARTFTTTTQ